jgi:hypothetical protein
LQQWNVAFQILLENCRLMELRLRKNIICKYRLRHVILVSNFFLKNPLI